MIIGSTSHKSQVFGGLGLGRHKRTFFILFRYAIFPRGWYIPTVLQVLWHQHQRCRWGRRPARSLAQLSPGEIELCWLHSISVHCVAEAARCQLDQFERSKLRMVPRLANLVAMFGQFGRRLICSNVKGHCHSCFFDNICGIDRCKWSDLQKSLARGAATDCRPLIPTVPLWALQVLWQRHRWRWGRRPAGSLAELSPGEVELWSVLSNSVNCVAEAARRQLDQFARSKLSFVPRLANLVGLARVTCKRSGNRLPPFIPTVLFWAFQVLQQRHQKCRRGRRPAGSLAQLSPGEVGLWRLLSYSAHCVAEAARCQLDQFERSNLLTVPRRANLVAMFGQFVETPCFFLNVKGHCHGCFFDNIERPKMWNRQVQMVGLARVTCKRSGNRLPPFIPTVLFWAFQVLCLWHQRRWGGRPAGSLAQLSPGEVGLWRLLSYSAHCVAEAAWCQLDQLERSKLLTVPRRANLVAMFGQFVETPCFFLNVKGHCPLSQLFLWQHWKAKNVK